MSFLYFIKLDKPEPTTVEVGSREGSAETGAEGAATGRKFRLDTFGQVCPFPLVEAKKAIAGLESGDALQIDFDCTQATDSIPVWAAQEGHSVTDFRQLDDASWSITVQKA